MQSANFRQRILVRLADGREIPLVTSARDVAAAQIVPEPADGQPAQVGEAWFMFRLTHAAALRLGADVPSDLDAYVDQLDGFDQLDGIPTSTPAGDGDGGDAGGGEPSSGLPDPTRPAGSATSPSG